MAPSTCRARRVPASAWEAHQEEIYGLYITQWMRLVEVMEHMRNQYGFSRTYVSHESEFLKSS